MYWIRNLCKRTKEKSWRRESKRVVEEQRLKLLNDEDEAILKQEEKQYTNIITPSDFSAIKDSFGIYKEDENGNQLFSTLQEQFLNEMKKYPSLKLYIAIYKDQDEYSIDRGFIHKKFNIMLPDRFEYIRKNAFTCFRLTLNPFNW